MTQRVPKKFYLVPRSLMYVNVCIKCVRDMDWKSSVNLGTHCHHYSFLASTLKLDSSQQGARWEVVQQRQRNAPRSSSVLDGCRPELLKPRNVLCKSERERERELSKQKELATLWPKYTLSVSSNFLFMYTVSASWEEIWHCFKCKDTSCT